MIYLILLLGLILRLVSLNQSLWLDEATSGLVVRNFSFAEIISKFSPGDFHPPLYYLLLKIWSQFFGTGEIGLRSLSIVAGVATIFMVYKISKSWVAALLLATSGLGIYYSQEARMYALAAFFVSLAVYFFLKRKWIWFSLFLLLLGMTDYPALLLIPIFWLVGRRFWRKLAVSHLPLAVAYFFWLPVLTRQFSAGLSVSQSAWGNILGRFSLKEIALIPVKFILGRIGFENKLLYALVVGIVGFVFGYLVIRGFGKARRWLRLWLTLPIVLAVIISFKLPILSYFRLLFVLPAFYLLLAKGAAKNKVFIAAILIINLISSFVYLFNPRFHREDWRSLAQALGSTPIVFPANSQKEALTYYGRGSQVISSDQIEKKEKEIWLSRYVWEVFDPDDTARQGIESLGYNKTDEYNFNGIVVWKYENKQSLTR